MEWIVWVLLCVGIFCLYVWLKSPKPIGTREKRQVRKAYIIGFSIAGFVLAGLGWILLQGMCGMWHTSEWWCV